MVYTRGGMWRTTIDDVIYKHPFDAQKAVEQWLNEEDHNEQEVYRPDKGELMSSPCIDYTNTSHCPVLWTPPSPCPKYHINQSTILAFIQQFSAGKDMFLNGMCYWFAHILHNRFYNTEIMYDAIANHFACRINGHIYDVLGEALPDTFESWDTYQKKDPTHAARIIRDCIDKRQFPNCPD